MLIANTSAFDKETQGFAIKKDSGKVVASVAADIMPQRFDDWFDKWGCTPEESAHSVLDELRDRALSWPKPEPRTAKQIRAAHQKLKKARAVGVDNLMLELEQIR